MTQNTRLVADVGGTNTRLAIFDAGDNVLRHVARFKNQDHESLASILNEWQLTLTEPAPTEACMAIAAPPSQDLITMVNIDWSFSLNDLARQFGFNRLLRLNDYEANAYALPHLGTGDLEQIYGESQGGHEGLCTIGPGTGLGGATLRWIAGEPVAFTAEPGYAGLSPASELELAIFRHLLPRHGYIYAELLISGRGLVTLYETVAALAGTPAEALQPADVSARGLDSSDPLCRQALETFCALYGSACGDFILSNGCYGGLFLGGGIAPRIVPFLRSSDFLTRMHSKGAMEAHLRAVPVSIITAEHPGLIGAAHAPIQPKRGK